MSSPTLSVRDLTVERIKARFYSESTSADPNWFMAVILQETEPVHDQLELIRGVIADVAWLTREMNLPVPPMVWPSNTTPQHHSLITAYMRAARFRYDFKFALIDEECRAWRTSFREDGLFKAHAAFAALGLRDPQAKSRLDYAMASDDLDEPTRYVLLQGIWFGIHLSDQADLIRNLTDLMIARDEVSPNLFYWRAYGFRIAGKYDTAMASIDMALARLPTGMNEVHQDYVRERELISTTANIAGQLEAERAALREDLRKELSESLGGAVRELEQRADEAARAVSQSLTNLVEILGVFVALIAFLASSGYLFIKEDDFLHQALLLGVVIIGSMMFFGLLRLIVNVPTARLRRRPRQTPGGGP